MGGLVATAKLFINGQSQAVRLPKEFRFVGDQVIIKRVGRAVMLLPIRYAAAELKSMLGGLDADFRIERKQPAREQRRRSLRRR